MGDPAPHAAACCPAYALRALTPAELASLDAWCARAMAHPDAEPRDGDEAAVVERYEAVLARPAVGVWGRARGRKYRRP